MLNSDVNWSTCEMVVTCDLLCWITTILACMLVGLKSLVISLDYRSYMGSSTRIWSLRWLFLYLCSYNLDGSVTIGTLVWATHIMTVKMAWICCKGHTCDEGDHCIWDMTWSHVTKVEKIRTRLGLMDRLQAWRASWSLLRNGPYGGEAWARLGADG
jgi:hypothetical protein